MKPASRSPSVSTCARSIPKPAPPRTRTTMASALHSPANGPAGNSRRSSTSIRASAARSSPAAATYSNQPSTSPAPRSSPRRAISLRSSRACASMPYRTSASSGTWTTTPNAARWMPTISSPVTALAAPPSAWATRCSTPSKRIRALPRPRSRARSSRRFWSSESRAAKASTWPPMAATTLWQERSNTAACRASTTGTAVACRWAIAASSSAPSRAPAAMSTNGFTASPWPTLAPSATYAAPRLSSTTPRCLRPTDPCSARLCPVAFPSAARPSLSVRKSSTATGPSGRSLEYPFQERVFILSRLRLLAGLLVLGLTAGCKAQTSPSVSSDLAVNRRIELQVRSEFELSNDVSVSVGARKPSDFSGYQTLPITLSHGAKTQEIDFLVSADGTKLVHLTTMDLTKTPGDSINLAGRPIRGNPSAKVTVINFDDLECPYCARMHQELFPATLAHYGDKIRV